MSGRKLSTVSTVIFTAAQLMVRWAAKIGRALQRFGSERRMGCLTKAIRISKLQTASAANPTSFTSTAGTLKSSHLRCNSTEFDQNRRKREHPWTLKSQICKNGLKSWKRCSSRQKPDRQGGHVSIEAALPDGRASDTPTRNQDEL